MADLFPPNGKYLRCYNKGCAQKFKEEDSKDEVCRYHPGVPVFHDAMKSWSCCKKRSTDFSDFLNTPGCTTGRHNPVKPEEPVKKPECLPEVVVAPRPLRVLQDVERPRDDLPYSLINPKVFNSLRTLLDKYMKQQEEEKLKKIQNGEEVVDGVEKEQDAIPIGTKCTNNSCDIVYVGPDTDLTQCHHHPGVAIFHDGYKYWSCCKRRTCDFNEFQRQEGCADAEHVWFKEVKKIQRCRYDWHQTGSMVIISIYAKACLPEKSLIKVNPTNVSVQLTFEHGLHEFLKDIKLQGVVDVVSSKVEMMSNKVEIKLKKTEPISWSDLHYREKE